MIYKTSQAWHHKELQYDFEALNLYTNVEQFLEPFQGTLKRWSLKPCKIHIEPFVFTATPKTPKPGPLHP